MACLHNPADRKRMLQYLSERYELIVSDCNVTEKDFDVCIIDWATYTRNREKIIEYKQSTAPVTLPFILFVNGERWSQTIDPVWEVVDDVVPIPTPTPILVSRIEAMLKIRQHSLQLQQKNEQLRIYEQAMDAANAGIIITDAREEDSPILYANRGFQQITGYSQEEIIGRNCRFLQNDDREQDAVDEIRSFISKGEDGHATLRNFRKDGTPFWNDLRIAPIKDSDGQITHFVGIQNDITELVNAHHKLEKERNLFEKLTQSSPVGITKLDAEGKITFANAQAEKILGLTKDKITKLGYNDPEWKIADPDGNPFPEEELPFAQVKKKGQAVYDIEHAIEWPDGSRKILSVNAAPLKGKGGVLEGVIASLADITENKKREKQLKEEREFIRTVVDNMPGIFYMLDEDLKFVFWNKNVVRDLGYSDEEIEKMHALDYIRPADREIVIDKIGEIFRAGSSDIEVDLVDKQGNAKRHFLIGTRFERNGKTYIIGSAVDITKRVEAEFESEQQQKLLSAIINQTDSIIYVKDKNGNAKLVNQQYRKLFDPDYSSAEPKVEKLRYKQEIAELIKENDQKVFTSGKLHRFKEKIPVGDDLRHYISIKYPLDNVPGFEGCICGISTDITDREVAFQQLKERSKEKACLYSIGSLNEKYDEIEKILEKAVQIIPEGFQYPDIAEAAIEYNGKVYRTPAFEHTKWGLISESHSFNSKSIAIKIVYREERPENDLGPFLKEEQELIDAIAGTLASQIDRIESMHQLEESEKRWEQLVQKNPGLVQIIDDDKIVFINPAGASIYGVDVVEDLIGRSWTEFISVEKDDIETIRKRISEAKKGNLKPPKIYRAWTVDEAERYIELQSVPVRYQGKTVLMTVGQEVTERVRFEQELKQSLREKEVLLQEIHHRVKNNLAVISSLLQIQRFSSDNELVNKVLSEGEVRIKSMALIHEKLYQAESLSEIDFKFYIDDLIKTINQTITIDDRIAIHLECESVNLNVNQAVPCALIISELLSNAVEHAFTEQCEGEVHISMTEKNGMVTVRVKDNGKGLPEGFEKEEMNSMGITIVSTLIHQLDTELKSGNDEGAFFEFTFEKRNIKGSSSALT